MLSKEKQKAIIEGLLFVSTQPITLSKIVKRLRTIDRRLTAPEEEVVQIDVSEVTEPSVNQVIDQIENSAKMMTSQVAFADGSLVQQNAVIDALMAGQNLEGLKAKVEDVVSAVEALKAKAEELDSEAVDFNVEEHDEEDEDESDAMAQLMQKQEELDQEIASSDVRELLKEMQKDLENDDRGIELVFVAKGYQLRTKYEIAEALKDEKVQAPSRFSPSSLETLAIVAYQQPITKQKVDQIRGVDSGGVIKTLLDKNILKIVGRSEEPGKPLVYGTSKTFMEIFGLESLKDLPSLQDYHLLQSSQDQDRLDDLKKQDAGIQLDDLVQDDYEQLSLEEQAVLDDLDESLKDLKRVEREVMAEHNQSEEAVDQVLADVELAGQNDDSAVQFNDDQDDSSELPVS